MTRRLIHCILLCALLCAPGACFAADSRDQKNMGAGIVIGSPVGITGKYWLSRENAIDGVFSVLGSNEIYLHADYLWHDYRAFPEPEEGKLPLYYGVGGSFTSDGDVSVRVPVGIAYMFEGYPFDVFLELAPVITFFHDEGFGLRGGIGARYYFEGGY